MKTTWCLLLAAALSLAMPHEAGATGTCTAARFHDWQDMGCNQNFTGAGGPTMPQPCPPGVCSPPSPPAHGMPRWWVSEPYVNLCLKDTPMSYTLSSGQEMSFDWYYRQRYQLPTADEVPNLYVTGDPNYATHYSGDEYFLLARTCGMTNAAWSGNWMKDIIFWDSQWEAAANGFNSRYPIAPFSDSYEALVFCPQGEIQYFYSTNNNTQVSLQEPRSQAKLQPLSASGYPSVNTPVADANGIFWGGAQTNGFQMVYPDGSKEIFGLCYYPEGLIDIYSGAHVAYTGAHAFLTQRIDPQGRVTQLGYQQLTNYNGFWFGYGVRYVVDPDGRTNTFVYATNNPAFYLYTSPNPWELQEVDDPYGRKIHFGYDFDSGILTSITDAAGLTSSFQYQVATVTNRDYIWSNGVVTITNIVGLGSKNGGWITNLTTPYGNTSFSYYQVTDSTVTNGFQQRAIYASEPTGAQQLYYYLHKGVATNGTSLLATSALAPTVPGITDFDDGTGGGTHPTLEYRNTIYWGRRQLPALSATVLASLPANMSNALANLTTNDFRKGRIRNWLWQADGVSISESLSSEREPSPDAAGQIEDTNRVWYNYASKPASSVVGSNPQVTCIASVLPDGTSQYTAYNYYSQYYPFGGAGLVSDSESSYSKPDNSIGVLTNWFKYAGNSIDLLSVSNSAGQYVNYGYNGSHQITTATNALGQITTLGWNPNLASIQWPGGASVSLNYSGSLDNGRLQTVAFSPSGRAFTINNYAAGLPSNITDDRGLTVGNTWDGLNRLIGSSFPDTTSISNVYYRLDLVATKDRLANWTSFAYDGLQHLTTVSNANHAVTFYSYCGCGSLTTILDALTNLTMLNYDNQGNLTNVVFPDYTSLTYQFDLAGRMTKAFDGANHYLQLAYNVQGLPTTLTGANGTLQSAIYDALNRPVSVTDANGVTVTNTFDAINEVIARTWPDGNGEGYGYSAAGLIAYTNRDQKATFYGRDGAGRLTGITNSNHEITRFGYDSLNNVTDLWDGNTNHSRWQYSEYGWLTNKLDGLQRNAFRYAYNANGRVTNRWTPEKGNTGYAYDNVGNLKAIAYPQQTISYAFDALSRLTNMVDAVGTTAFSYTPAGQLQTENGPWASDTVAYTYVQGLRTNLSITQPGGTWSQGYGYDSGWRMTSITSPAGGFNYSYNFKPASSLVTGIGLPNGANIVNGYDSLARLTQTSLNNYWGHPLDSYTYAPDALGLRTNIVRNLGLTTNSVIVGFDNIGQLTSWSASEMGGLSRQNEQLGFGYDAAHNLHTRNNGSLAQTFTTDAANQLNSVSRTGNFTESGATPAPATSVTVNGQAAKIYSDLTFARTNLMLADGQNTFTNIAVNSYGVKVTNIVTVNFPLNVGLGFDNNGSLTNDGAIMYGYDSENQLTNMTVPGNWKSDFVYDGLNRRRIERDYTWQGSWVKTSETHFIYDGYLPIQERDSNNVPLVTYTRGLDLSGSLQGAGGVGGLLARTSANGTVFYHADAVGNITALMDGSENIVGRYLYGPGGVPVAMSGPLAFANVMRAFSEPVHPLSGISHLPFRDLNTKLLTFLTSDPRGEAGGIPLRGFAKNNPLRYVDPWGWQAEELDVKQERTEPEMRPPAERLLPNGNPRPLNYEDRLNEQLERDIAAEAMRRQGLDPNQTYIGPRPEELKPSTPEQAPQQPKASSCPQNSGGGITSQNTPSFFHYTSNPSLAGGGLRPGSGVTTAGNMTAQEALLKLGVNPPPQYVYPITLQRPGDYLIPDTGIPARSQVTAYEVFQQTPPGSVGPSRPVPPGK